MKRMMSSGDAEPETRRLSRRDFLGATVGALLPMTLAGCATDPVAVRRRDPSRLSVRPTSPVLVADPGATRLSRGSFGRGAILYVPEGYDPGTAAPLLVTLHGRPGNAELWVPFYPKCDQRGIIMLAVESRGITWDLAATGQFGPDVEFIDWALSSTFGRCNVDPEAIALCGFSDGASYTLSLGPSNGDLFSRLIAFSPGFSDPGPQLVGDPEIWISHGYDDSVFDEDYTAGEIVPRLRENDYAVEYTPFEGGHEVPAAISDAALDWFVS